MINLTPVRKEDIEGYKPTKVFAILQEFANSGYEAVRVDGHDYKNAFICAQAFNKSAQRFNMIGIKAITRKEAVYLIKEIDK